MSSSTTATYHRQVRQYLRDVYQVSEVRDVGGSSHPAIKFEYGGITRHVTLNGTTHGPTAFEMKRQDIRRELGEPPAPPPTREPRRLEVMTPAAPEKPGSYRLNVARYKTGRGCLEFRVPSDLISRLGWTEQTPMGIEPVVGADMWLLSEVSAAGKASHFSSRGGKSGAPCLRFTDPRVTAGPALFLASTAEAVIDDGKLMVSLLKAVPGVGRPAGSRGQKPPPEEEETHASTGAAEEGAPDQVDVAAPPEDVRRTVASWTPATSPDPHNVLEAVRAVEASTPYRLIKLATGEWAFRAPLIK